MSRSERAIDKRMNSDNADLYETGKREKQKKAKSLLLDMVQKKAKGGRIDGVAQRGKTRGTIR